MTEQTTTPPETPIPQGRRDEEFFTELTWRVLFRPNRSAKQGSMSAGMILVVVSAAMLIAMFVNASSIAHKSRSKNADTWRYSVASFFDSVSSTLHLTSPRVALDEALGRGTEEVEEEEGTVTLAQSADDPDAGHEVTLRTPTEDEPLRVHISGDSIVGIFGNQLKKASTETGLLDAELDYEPSTGLSRPDFFNWKRHLSTVNKDDDPEVLVLMFGANDIQGMVLDDAKTAVQPGTPEWFTEYRKRVAELMDRMEDVENHDRMVLWVGALPMGPNSGVEDMPEVNYIYATEAAMRPWVTFVDSWPFFVDGAGNYSSELPDAEGSLQLLREGDNIHLTRVGGDRLAFVVLGALAEMVDPLAATLSPTPDQAVPDGLAQRDEVPKPPGLAD